MDDSVVCFYCGVRRPSKGMILVEPTDNEDGNMWFCDWFHLGNHVTSECQSIVEEGKKSV